MKRIALTIFILFLINFNALANNLQIKREEAVKQYLMALNNKDINKISALFVNDGYVVSTSKGKINASKFFSEFLSELKSSKVEIFNLYKDPNDPNHYAARFHFSWLEKNGETGSGNYMDDFSFANNTNKLVTVFMFENKSTNK